jgi:hypothetical protein
LKEPGYERYNLLQSPECGLSDEEALRYLLQEES